MRFKHAANLSGRLRLVLGARGTLVLVLGCLFACRGGEPRARAEAAALRRQIAGLRELLGADKGTVFSSQHLAIGIKAELVRDLFQKRLPVETVLVGQVRIRIETADIAFESSESLVTLKGRISHVQDSDAFADFLVLGGLHRFEVDARSGVLTAHIDLDHLEVQRLKAGTAERGLTLGLTETLGGRSLGALGEVLPAIEIPIRLNQAIEFGGYAEGVVSVAPRRLPLRVSVARVIPVAGRLWVLLDVSAREEAASLAASGRRR